MGNIETLKVYQYTFLDDLSFIKDPNDLDDDIKNNFIKDIEKVKNKFLDAGWEGDGKIGIIWIPPFIDLGVEDTWGSYVWHVKQRNNGISFLLMPEYMSCARLG